MKGAPHPSAARIVDFYERGADQWDAARAQSTFFERKLMERIADALAPGASVLDVGCGAGWPIAAHFVERGFAVTGVDSAPSLVALCRARYPGGEWLAADMRTLDLGRRFGAVIAWHSTFHLPPDDQRAMFPIFAQHAEPGALLLFTSGDALGEKVGEMFGEPLYHASLDPEEYLALLDANGFDIVDRRAKDEECGETRWWLARKRA